MGSTMRRRPSPFSSSAFSSSAFSSSAWRLRLREKQSMVLLVADSVSGLLRLAGDVDVLRQLDEGLIQLAFGTAGAGAAGLAAGVAATTDAGFGAAVAGTAAITGFGATVAGAGVGAAGAGTAIGLTATFTAARGHPARPTRWLSCRGPPVPMWQRQRACRRDSRSDLSYCFPFVWRAMRLLITASTVDAFPDEVSRERR
jgi:hypothetical protein